MNLQNVILGVVASGLIGGAVVSKGVDVLGSVSQADEVKQFRQIGNIAQEAAFAVIAKSTSLQAATDTITKLDANGYSYILDTGFCTKANIETYLDTASAVFTIGSWDVANTSGCVATYTAGSDTVTWNLSELGTLGK